MMKKTYKIEVACANCAQKMEDAANTVAGVAQATVCLIYTSPSPRAGLLSRMPSSA